MSELAELVARVVPADPAAAAAAQAALDAKTKPRGSLGRLEQLACRLAGIVGGVPQWPLEAAIVVAAADHGIAAEGVSAYPQEVTVQMVANFAAGGAAINVLARQAGARLLVVDVGVASPYAHDLVRAARLGAGTRSFVAGPAMERRQASGAILAGAALAAELVSDDVGVIGVGEMGIGNTTAASAVTCALLSVDPVRACGRGTGVDEEGLARKVDVVKRALALHALDPDDPVGVLAAVGGFELAYVAGIVIGAAGARVPVLLDGFITGAAALAAARLAPAAVDATIAAHRSPEPGHALVLDALGLEPLLDLGLRLGEGTGAALALPLVRSSVAILHEMATFEAAGVTDAGR